MTKEEVEKLLRHGAYDIFNEDKAGTAEAESNDFQEQTIDSILSRRSRNIVHENTGSGSAAAGGTFSKASFVNKTTPSKKEGDDGNGGGQATEDIDINDPDFWTVRYLIDRLSCFVFVFLEFVFQLIMQFTMKRRSRIIIRIIRSIRTPTRIIPTTTSDIASNTTIPTT